MAASGGTADLKLAGGLGTARATAFQFGFYGFMQFSPHFYGSLAAVAGINRLTTSRTVNGVGQRSAQRQSDGGEFRRSLRLFRKHWDRAHLVGRAAA